MRLKETRNAIIGMHMFYYEPGEIIDSIDNEYYVYELLDDDGEVFFIGSTLDPKLTLRRHLKPVTKKKHEVYYNMHLKRALMQVKHLKLRIVSRHKTSLESEKARDTHISELRDTAILYNVECRPL